MSFKKMYLIPVTDENTTKSAMASDRSQQQQTFETEQINSQAVNLGGSSSSNSTGNENIFDSRLKNIVNSNLAESEKLEIVKSIIGLYDRKQKKSKQPNTKSEPIPISRIKLSPKKQNKNLTKKSNKKSLNKKFLTDQNESENIAEDEIDNDDDNESLNKLSLWNPY